MENKIAITTVKMIKILVLIFTLLGLLCGSVYGLLKAKTYIKINRVAVQLLSFSAGFKKYENDKGLLPADSLNVLPDGMQDYINPDDWNSDALGGHFNWEGPYWGERGGYEYAGIALFGTTATMRELILLDRKIDDGNLSAGKFRQTSNGRYTYVFEERP